MSGNGQHRWRIIDGGEGGDWSKIECVTHLCPGYGQIAFKDANAVGGGRYFTTAEITGALFGHVAKHDHAQWTGVSSDPVFTWPDPVATPAPARRDRARLALTIAVISGAASLAQVGLVLCLVFSGGVR